MTVTPTKAAGARRFVCSFGLVALVLATLVACGGEEGGGAPGDGRGGGGQAMAHNGPPGGPAEAIPVELAAVRREDMAARYSTSSTLRASRRATVTTRSNGVIRSLLVEEGDRVREGQVLARLESEEQRIAFERAESTRETRQRELARLERLYEQELVSEEAFETARRDFVDARHAAELARVELERTQIVAPFDGIVLRRHLDVGNTVTSGTSVYDLADVTPLYTDVTVPERQVRALQVGQQVSLSPDAAGGEAVTARIERIAPEVDPGTGTVKVTLAVEEGSTLRPGTFVRVDITTDVHPDTLVVPRSALVAEGRRWYVFVVGDEDTAAKTEVELGYVGRERVEVRPLAGGALAEGSRVVVAGAGALEDGAKVQVSAAPEATTPATVAEGAA